MLIIKIMRKEYVVENQGGFNPKEVVFGLLAKVARRGKGPGRTKSNHLLTQKACCIPAGLLRKNSPSGGEIGRVG